MTSGRKPQEPGKNSYLQKERKKENWVIWWLKEWKKLYFLMYIFIFWNLPWVYIIHSKQTDVLFSISPNGWNRVLISNTVWWTAKNPSFTCFYLFKNHKREAHEKPKYPSVYFHVCKSTVSFNPILFPVEEYFTGAQS